MLSSIILRLRQSSFDELAAAVAKVSSEPFNMNEAFANKTYIRGVYRKLVPADRDTLCVLVRRGARDVGRVPVREWLMLGVGRS